MGNRHFNRRNILPCSSISRDISSSSDASSLRSSKSSSSSKSDAIVETEVSPEHFRVIKRIGNGSFGQVYAVEKRNSRELYAMKLIEKDSGEDRITSIKNEVEILTSLSHPSIITLWFAFQKIFILRSRTLNRLALYHHTFSFRVPKDEDTIYLIFELLAGGDLRRCLEGEGHLPEARVLIYICELALALDYLKTKRILHRDIKPENLLLDNQDHIRLTDFNIAIELEDGQFATSMSGTKPYMAPEVYKCILNMGPGYSFPADWWSLGVCAYELLCGERPYDIHSRTSYEDILAMILLRKLTFPKRIQSEMGDLIRQMLCADIEQRVCSLHQMRTHPHLALIDFDQLHSIERRKNSEQLSES